jgi:hypothetical protein
MHNEDGVVEETRKKGFVVETEKNPSNSEVLASYRSCSHIGTGEHMISERHAGGARCMASS